jgi:hypothetical protein
MAKGTKEVSAPVLEPIIIKKKSNLAQYRPDTTVFYQKDRDYDEQGEPIPGDKFNPTQGLIGAMQNITPQWDDEAGRWAFYGSVEDLQRIAKRLGLTDDKTKQIITVTEDDLYNRFSPFWGNPVLWKSLFIEETSRYLEADKPINELFNRVLRGREDLEQPGRTDQSKLITDRASFELISPTIERDKKKQGTEEVTTAMKAYIDLIGDEERLELAYLILDPSDYEENKDDAEAIKASIQTEFVNGDEYVSKYKTSTRKFFIEVARLDPAELVTYATAIRAKKAGVIRPSMNDGYTFKGEKLNNGDIKSDAELCKFLKDPNNSDIFLAVEEALNINKR